MPSTLSAVRIDESINGLIKDHDPYPEMMKRHVHGFSFKIDNYQSFAAISYSNNNVNSGKIYFEKTNNLKLKDSIDIRNRLFVNFDIISSIIVIDDICIQGEPKNIDSGFIYYIKFVYKNLNYTIEFIYTEKSDISQIEIDLR